ncbi:MAG TPA: class I SAM-dependent methyltransferase [Solirubrobacteraceae bacterium]|nr:class I SAM-dependent methyltransferase [Solirubrobacteraceae bacterium]
MTNEASQAFGAYAADYDEPRRRLVPVFDAFYGAVLDALRALPAPGGRLRVLDLGAGTGLLTGMVAQTFPAAEIVALDGSAEMLALARERLGDRAEYVVADLRDPDAVPAHPSYDAVVSALAIHHLEDADKRSLYARVLDALEPGGVFANAEQVLGETPEATAADLEWHRREAIARGTGDEEWAAALERFEHDRCATAAAQLAWLRELGFADVSCPFRMRRFAVLVGSRPRGDGR